MKFILTSFLFFSSLLGAETRLAILGSGTPNPDPQRMGSAYAVIVNDNAYLVDFGPGESEERLNYLRIGVEI